MADANLVSAIKTAGGRRQWASSWAIAVSK